MAKFYVTTEVELREDVVYLREDYGFEIEAEDEEEAKDIAHELTVEEVNGAAEAAILSMSVESLEEEADD